MNMVYMKLGDICSPKQWKTISTSKLTSEGYPVYGANGIIGYYKEFNHIKETILVTCRGATCGSVNITRPYSYVNGNAMALDNLDERFDINYLYFYLSYRGFNDVISGSAQPQIIRSAIEKILIPLYPIEQQRKIASLFIKINNIHDLYRKENDRLDELIKSRFVEMFGSLNNNENCFDVLSIEEVCTLIKDGTHQTPIYTEDKQNGFKFLSSKDVMTQRICWDEIKYIPAKLHEKLYAAIQPKRNDILMSKNGVNYGVAAVNDTNEIFDIYVSLALLRPKTNKVNPMYLRCAINNPDTKHQFDASIKGVGVPNLHLGEIKKTKILVPPMEMQNTFVEFITQVDKLKVSVSRI